MAAPENRRRGRGARPRWVDNQSTESSFHTHKFKAGAGEGCGGCALLREGGGEKEGWGGGRRGGEKGL